MRRNSKKIISNINYTQKKTEVGKSAQNAVKMQRTINKIVWANP